MSGTSSSADPSTGESSTAPTRDPASFRDPSGFVYRRNGTIHRQINRSFAGTWEDLTSTPVLADLQRRELVIGHEDATLDAAFDPATAHAVIRPDPVDFVSYPYEWTFGQLKDAALLTLDVQSAALKSGFVLRDATAYNVQFQRGRPILIDTLSLERAKEGEPWIAYRQFCEHFLAPLALIAYRHAGTRGLLREFIDGIPLDLAASLLPGRTRLRLGLASHIHLHARAQRAAARASPTKAPARRMTSFQLAALVDSLRRTVEGLDWQPAGTVWADYAGHTSYGEEATRRKESTVDRFLRAAGGRVVWDIGANTGRYSAIAAAQGARVLALDSDAGASEIHYQELRKRGDSSTLPLVVDICNPSPGLGWATAERRSLLDRADADVVLGLALVHHLAIGRNVPLPWLAELLARLAPAAIIEFVPKSDPMAARLLSGREDVFDDYTEDGFRRAFAPSFDLAEAAPIEGTERTLFRMVRRG